MKNYTNILIEKHDFYTTIILNRPEKRNAFDAEMIADITEAFELEGSKEENRCILLRGNGKSFSAGADLNYMKEMASFSKEENIADSEQLFSLFATIYNCSLPTICYVHGASFGGSNGIIAACDYTIAHVETTFSFSEVKLGLVPATISPFVFQKIGEANALNLFLTGQRFNSNKALEAKLVHEVVSESEKDEAISDYINQFKTSAPSAVKTSKELIRKLSNFDVSSYKKMTSELIANARVGSEGQEGISAFFDKRKPNWHLKKEEE